MKEVWVHDIVNGITVARAYAETFATQRPEVTEPVQKLIGDLARAQKAFVDAVMPILRLNRPDPL
jgi:hypothetical protein